jgi:hypothetical protein
MLSQFILRQHFFLNIQLKKQTMWKNVVLSFVILYGCNDSSQQNTVKQSAEVTINLLTKSNGALVKLGTYYLLANGDSIVINRLDYYISGMSAKQSGSSKRIDSILLYSLANLSNSIYHKSDSIPLTIDSLSFLCGVDSATNASNPNSFNLTHPLSGSKNMYWVSWSKYRYIVFEGNIKSPSQDYPFSFHTGLNYKYSTTLTSKIKLIAGSPNKVNLVLHIDKIFSPTSGSKIFYESGETQAHSDISDGMLTAKFGQNFSRAFTVE